MLNQGAGLKTPKNKTNHKVLKVTIDWLLWIRDAYSSKYWIQLGFCPLKHNGFPFLKIDKKKLCNNAILLLQMENSQSAYVGVFTKPYLLAILYDQNDTF